MNGSGLLDKATQRAIYRDYRKALSAEELKAKSRAIAAAITHLKNIVKTNVVMTYVSFGLEVDTRELIDDLKASGKRVLIPSASEHGRFQWAIMERWADLAAGSQGVLEPRVGIARFVEAPADAPVLVPGLAFTPAGTRLGYGSGGFDRFLAGHRGVSIGLALDGQLAAELPAEPHDVPVDVVVTESQVYGDVTLLEGEFPCRQPRPPC